LCIASAVGGGFNPAVAYRKIALVGVGLLGGSLALAIRERKIAVTVQGFVRRDSSLAECEQAGLTGFATRDLAAAVRDADLIILCTPLAQMKALARDMLPALKPGAIVSDVGSVKETVIAELESMVANAGAQFIGAHPMAGSEKMGVRAARGDLFQGAVCVITPTPSTPAPAVQALESFWRDVGTRTVRMTAALHDELVARCSHLPHVLAAALVNLVLDPAQPPEQALLCANGFRDTTRIASGSPEMWRDIALANSGPLAIALDTLMQQLTDLRLALQRGDTAAVEGFFADARRRREGWSSQSVSPSPE
jgi:prephenate dehydrogenase